MAETHEYMTLPTGETVRQTWEAAAIAAREGRDEAQHRLARALALLGRVVIARDDKQPKHAPYDVATVPKTWWGDVGKLADEIGGVK